MANAVYSNKRLKKIAQKLGFFVFEGRNHSKVKDENNNFVTTIPRHNNIKKELVNGIIDALIKNSNLPEDKISKIIKRY